MTRSTFRKTTLNVRALEAREVPATLAGGILLIEGTNYADTVNVRYRADLELIEGRTETRAPPTAFPKPPVSRMVEYFAPPEVRAIHFFGFGGNDVFQNDIRLGAGGRVIADGGAGNDRLQTVSPFGTPTHDGVIPAGGGGKDVLGGG